MTNGVVGMVTCATRAEARRVARAILAKKLAACVNILGGVESHYWWKGKRERAAEQILVIKTTRARVKMVEHVVKTTHSYQVPEIIFLPIVAGERNYLKWLNAAVKKTAVGILLAVSVATVRADRIDDLTKQLDDADETVRAEAADNLTKIGGARVEKQFREMLESTSPERRQTAVVGLLQISEADGDLELVRKRLKDENSTVRWSAVLALGQSARAEAIPWLEEVAKSDDTESVREEATESLTRLRSNILWLRSLAGALKQARELHKPVLAYFHLRGSDVCQRYEEGVLGDRAVVDAAEEFVCVRIDAGRQADEARKLDVRGAPTLLVLDAQGNEMSRITGLVEKAALLARLAETRQGKLTFREARRLALKDPADVRANWKVASTYLEEGREDLAEPHLRNVIDHDEQNLQGYTDKALFALGFALGKRAEYARAVACFDTLLTRWPGCKDKDKALYCLGLSQLALGQAEKGRAALEQLIREFPESTTVPSAQQALEKLGAKEPNDEPKK